jgi:predicted RNase H-like nuclease (RuvC/YqgF family)
VEEKMKSFPRQAKEIESLTSQLSAANNRIRVLDGALERQRTELMALREKVLLLEQRPLQSRLNTARESRDFWRRAAERLETEVEIAKEQSSHYKEKYRRVTDRQSVDSQMRGHANTLPPCDCPMCEARGM